MFVMYIVCYCFLLVIFFVIMMYDVCCFGLVSFRVLVKSIFWKLKGKKLEDRDGREKGLWLVYIIYCGM